jgi:transposase
MAMERLESKKVNGRTYYYYSEWGWKDGKCRRIWQKYLGKPKDIVEAVQGGGPPPLYAEVFQWGLPCALWKEVVRARIVEEIDALCPKREQGLSTGQYMAVAAVNRAIRPKSKRSMWEWFSQTALLRFLPMASKAALGSPRFWDHMGRVDGETAMEIWKRVLSRVVKNEDIDLSSVSYDGTNFYTFIDTFNVRCQMAKRGKNKQGRNNLRQISYALFCASDGHMPLYYDVYDGNRNDAKEFPGILKRFQGFLDELSDASSSAQNTTVIFDKGNNSKANFALLDALEVGFVGSVKLDEHKDLAEIPNDDPCFQSYPELEGTKGFRVEREVYGKPRTLVVTFNQNLYDAQWLTVQNDLSKAVEKLSSLRQKLEDRAAGIITRGRCPSKESIEGQCKGILSRQHMKRLIKTEVSQPSDGVPRLSYDVDAEAFQALSETCLGKTILITNRKDWDEASIISAYRSQFIIEGVFKEMKDRQTGSWWPLHHWTDSKIRVHALYCTIALLLRALALRRVRRAGLTLSMPRFLAELDTIREVINVYPKKRGKKAARQQTVLTKTSELQDRILTILGLSKDKIEVLG